MFKKAALLTVHGMGKTQPDYNLGLVNELKARLGSDFDDLHIGSFYYQSLLQPNEERVWRRVAGQVRWDGLREFLLFGFADAAGLESGKEAPHSVYWQVQARLARALLAARQAMGGDGPLLILAESLGCQVVSCYFWDAMRLPRASVGIWANPEASLPQVFDRPVSDADLAFLRGSHFRLFVTTGCNIPLFVAAHAKDEILPIRPNADFLWHNYFDKDDILGWPLAPLSPEYERIVLDHPINAGGLFESWNPMSHTRYWTDDDFLDPLEASLRVLLREAV